MPTFTYLARNAEGKSVNGMLTAETEQLALRLLDEQALFPMEIREGGAAGTGKRRRKVKTSKVATVYSQFADLLRAGVPALRSLDVMTRQTSHAVLKEVLKEVREDISSGQTLAEAMGKHSNVFLPLHVSMIAAGEKGGFLEEVLCRIAAFTERQNELRNKLMGAMIYPAMLLFFGSIIVSFVLVFVAPKIRPLLRGDLPWVTDAIFAIADFLSVYGLHVLGGIVVGGLLVGGFVRSPTGKGLWDKASLKMPGMGPIVTLVAICRFCRILGTLLHNGVPILQSLKIARDSAGNSLLIAAVEEATESVRKGSTLAAPLGKSGLFPLDITDMIAVGEESNNLENVLVTIADSYEVRTARQIDLFVRVLEPLLLVGMAVIVGTIAVALIIPILTMSQNVT